MDALLSLPQETLLGLIGALDAMPDGGRAGLSALLLVAFLRLFERRIPEHEIQYGQSFRKTALAALIIIPLFVCLVPASRMTVFVEALAPVADGTHPAWLLLLAAWMAGAALSLFAFVRSEAISSRDFAALPAIEDEKLIARLAHWRRRLGMETDYPLVAAPGTMPRFIASGTRVALPAAACHWPGNLQDLILITALVHLKRRHRRWHLIGRFVSALYWPIPWVQTLANNLMHDFERAADELAESCYRDPLGYERALRQLSQRLAPQAGSGEPTIEDAAPPQLPDRIIQHCIEYARRLKKLLDATTEQPWHLDRLLEARSRADKLAWTDPYDKVVLFIGQAVFFAFILTGATLEEKPPELDYEYSLPFELFWKEHFHRNLEIQEKVQPMQDS